jgi:hypothetical protein
LVFSFISILERLSFAYEVLTDIYTDIQLQSLYRHGVTGQILTGIPIAGGKRLRLRLLPSKDLTSDIQN